MKQENKAPKRGKKFPSEEAYVKLWKLEQLKELPPGVPEAVKSRAREIIETLNRHYGEDRHVDEDLGGYLALFPDTYQMKDHEALLDRHRLGRQEPEYRKPLCQDGSMIWIEELFLCGSDYSLVIVRTDPLEGKDGERKQRKTGGKQSCSNQRKTVISREG